KRFDAILLANVLQHLDAPVDVLRRLRGLLGRRGVVAGSVPNLGIGRRWSGRWLAQNKRRYRVLSGDFASSRLNLTSMSDTKRWLDASGFASIEMRYGARARPESLPGRWAPHMPGGFTAPDILFIAR